jgi:hypothetical protein
MERPRFRLQHVLVLMVFLAMGLAIIKLTRENVRLRDELGQAKVQRRFRLKISRLRHAQLSPWRIQSTQALRVQDAVRPNGGGELVRPRPANDM